MGEVSLPKDAGERIKEWAEGEIHAINKDPRTTPEEMVGQDDRVPYS